MNKIPIGYFNNVVIGSETQFGPETQLNLVIDSSGNMDDTKDQLDILVQNDLKNLLLPFYLTDENYNKSVRVIEDNSERPYQMMSTFDLSSNNAFVFTFVDEATPYGDIYSTANANVIDDLTTLVSKVSSYPKEYRGFLFRVSTESIFGESYKLSEIMYAVFNKHVPYTNTVFNDVQVPKRKENVFVNNYNVADNAFLEDFADLNSTVMTTNTKYKYYGYEIVKALNESIVNINLENDSSILQSFIGNNLTYSRFNSRNYSIIQIGNQLPYSRFNSRNYSIIQIGNQLTYSRFNGEVSTHRLIGNQLTYSRFNGGVYTHTQIGNQLTYSRFNGTLGETSGRLIGNQILYNQFEGIIYTHTQIGNQINYEQFENSPLYSLIGNQINYEQFEGNIFTHTQIGNQINYEQFEGTIDSIFIGLENNNVLGTESNIGLGTEMQP